MLGVGCCAPVLTPSQMLFFHFQISGLSYTSSYAAANASQQLQLPKGKPSKEGASWAAAR